MLSARLLKYLLTCLPIRPNHSFKHYSNVCERRLLCYVSLSIQIMFPCFPVPRFQSPQNNLSSVRVIDRRQRTRTAIILDYWAVAAGLRQTVHPSFHSSSSSISSSNTRRGLTSAPLSTTTLLDTAWISCYCLQCGYIQSRLDLCSCDIEDVNVTYQWKLIIFDTELNWTELEL